MRFLLLPISVLLLVSASAFAQDAVANSIEGEQPFGDELEKPLPIVSVRSGQLNIEMPVFEDRVFSQQRRDFDVHIAKEVSVFMKEIVRKAVIERKNALVLAGVAGKNILVLMYNLYGEFKKLEKPESDEMSSEYTSKMSDFLDSILQASSEIKLSDKEVHSQVVDFIDSIEELAEASPVGLYLNWSEGKVQGKNVVEYLGPHLQWFRDNGYKRLLNIIRTVAGWMRKLNIGKAKKTETKQPKV